ncbi:dTDP-4-dehydrorhamnose reductase [Sphingobacterium gobiense]|uniref:dTDP-4-dehydrorhamnose reductase n=1 Tax=Sphingobacterium gobiense TaxID=1382456 RepID=A0A2S9JG37_9SPHI|nr:dTDP-4-dehydrorhamnose reductase [Sphingobacterium gobiense]PRD51922.1 dTDP-4-dehydrorhamnose reductase [Sphingobacterium gobiense]
MKILVTGARGQLGSEIRELSKGDNIHEYIFVDRDELPLNDLTTIVNVLDAVCPDVIMSGGAYTAVDKAESEPELVDTINHQAVAVIAEWSNHHRKRLIHISTDYVFQGTSDTPLKEDEPTDPINVYGLTKQRGEQAILQSGADAVIIRTAWVYSSHGANFVKTMIRLMKEQEEISVIADQIGSPTYAGDLAKAVMDIIQSDNWTKGIYHFSNEGRISWYDFAVAIRDLQGLQCKVNAIPTTQYPTPAKRPQYSLLDKSKIKAVYSVAVPKWLDSLKVALARINSDELASTNK